MTTSQPVVCLVAAANKNDASGNVEPVDHVAAILASRGLQYVPDEL